MTQGVSLSFDHLFCLFLFPSSFFFFLGRRESNVHLLKGSPWSYWYVFVPLTIFHPISPSNFPPKEREAYSGLISAFAAQGELTWKKEVSSPHFPTAIPTPHSSSFPLAMPA